MCGTSKETPPLYWPDDDEFSYDIDMETAFGPMLAGLVVVVAAQALAGGAKHIQGLLGPSIMVHGIQ